MRINLSVGNRVRLGFLVMIVLTAIASSIGLVSSNSASQALNTVQDGSLQANAVHALQLQWNEVVHLVDNILLSRQTSLVDTQLAAALAEFDRQLGDLQNQPSVDPLLAVENQAIIEDLQTLGGDLSTVAQQIGQYSKDGSWARAQALRYTEMASLQRRLTENLDLLNDNAARASDLAFTQSEILQRSARAQLIFVVVFAVAASLVMGYFTTRSILTPINQLLTRVQAIMRRDFSHVDPLPRRDEFGQLSQAMTLMTDLLKETYRQLEQKVAERTRALKTSAEVSRRLSTILDPRHLAIEVVEQLQSAFNYYHAHIYFFDEARENLVMAGGTGEAGKALLERGHRIPRGRGLVGRAAETNEVILAPDISQEPDWLPNPLLPETRSEIAVPIAAGNQVVGVLDVQNDTAGSLGQEDADLILTIADQVAVAVQNARLYTQAETSKQEAQSLVDYAPEAIGVVDLETGLFADLNANAEKLYGLPREELIKVGPAQMSPPRQPDGRDSTEKAMEKINEAMQGGAPVFEWTHRNAQGQDIPCEVRLLRLPGGHPRVRFSAADITERKRLQEQVVQRARQQEAINLITQRIQGAATVEMALQIAARELGHALGQKQTLVVLERDKATAQPADAQERGRQ